MRRWRRVIARIVELLCRAGDRRLVSRHGDPRSCSSRAWRSDLVELEVTGNACSGRAEPPPNRLVASELLAPTFAQAKSDRDEDEDHGHGRQPHPFNGRERAHDHGSGSEDHDCAVSHLQDLSSAHRVCSAERDGQVKRLSAGVGSCPRRVPGNRRTAVVLCGFPKCSTASTTPS